MAEIEAPFDSLDGVYSAYYGEDSTTDPDGPGGNDGNGEDSANWGPTENADVLQGGWYLNYQNHVSNDSRRWWLVRQVDGTFEVITSNGFTEEIQQDTPVGNLPTYSTEEEARSAHEKWLDDNPDAETPDGGENAEWNKWSKLREVEPWWIFARSHKSSDHVQLLASGVLSDDSTVYLGSNGGVQSSAHIFTSVEALQSALEAYFQGVQNGDIPEAQQPTGDSPPTPGPRVGGGSPTGNGNGGESGGQGPAEMLGRIASAARERPMLTAAVGIGAAYAVTQADLDLDGGFA